MVRMGAAAVVIAAATLALAGCAPTPVATVHVYAYECCSAKDVDTIYSPGQTVHLHWTAHLTSADAATRAAHPVISAELYGPSATGAGAKKLAGKTALAVAADLHPSLTTPQKLSSDLVIPADAAPGFYDLEFLTTWSPGNSDGGATIIQVK